MLFTPIEQIAGNGSSLDRAMVPGGASGCDRVSFDPVAPLTPGDGYVLFFAPVMDSEGSMAGDLMLIGAWPVLEDGSVSTAFLGDLAVRGSEGLDRQRTRALTVVAGPRCRTLDALRRSTHTPPTSRRTGCERDEYPSSVGRETRWLVETGATTAGNGPGSLRTEREGRIGGTSQ